MHSSKWREIVENIKDHFEVEDEGVLSEDQDGGIETEYIIFKGPLGRMKLEYETRPVVEGKKTIYSNRIGAGTKVDYIYSTTERTARFKASVYQADEACWVGIDASRFE